MRQRFEEMHMFLHELHLEIAEVMSFHKEMVKQMMDKQIVPRVLRIERWRCGKPLDDEWLINVAVLRPEDYDRVMEEEARQKVAVGRMIADAHGAMETMPDGGKPWKGIAPVPEGFTLRYRGRYLVSDRAWERLNVPADEDVTERVVAFWEKAPTGGFRRVVSVSGGRLLVSTDTSNSDSDGLRYSRMDGRPKGAQRIEADSWDFQAEVPIILRWEPLVYADGIALRPRLALTFPNDTKTLEGLGIHRIIRPRTGFVVFLCDERPTIIVEGEL